jgi:hypothetical protein
MLAVGRCSPRRAIAEMIAPDLKREPRFNGGGLVEKKPSGDFASGADEELI